MNKYMNKKQRNLKPTEALSTEKMRGVYFK